MTASRTVNFILMRTSVKAVRCYARIIVVSLAVFALTLILLQAGQPGAGEPFVPISVRYPASADVDRMRQDFQTLRSAGFNAVTTSISWREGEPRRGAYSLLNI